MIDNAIVTVKLIGSLVYLLTIMGIYIISRYEGLATQKYNQFYEFYHRSTRYCLIRPHHPRIYPSSWGTDHYTFVLVKR